MDYISSRAIMIAVSLLVTIAIVSSVFVIINQVIGIYKTVYETDTQIQSRFGEFEAYDNTEKIYLDAVNTVKKYRNSDRVYVTFKRKSDIDSITNEDTKIQQIKAESLPSDIDFLEDEEGNIEVDETMQNKLNEKYMAYVEELDNGKVIIFFNKK